MRSARRLLMRARDRLLRRSQLDNLIPPEIIGDRFADVIRSWAAAPDVRVVLEIGSSSGEGSTAALVAGLEHKPDAHLYCIELSRPRYRRLAARYADRDWVHCYNLPSVPLAHMPSADEVRAFYRQHPASPLTRTSWREVHRWLQQDLAYVRQIGAADTGIEAARRDAGVETFDLVLIDGSEFTGAAELAALYGARYVLLDDITTYKCSEAFDRLARDPDYVLLEHDAACRNGFAAFRRR